MAPAQLPIRFRGMHRSMADKPAGTLRRVVVTTTLALVGAGASQVTAYAGGNGNGRGNINQFTINSPVINRGIQHSNDGNIFTKDVRQTAFCKKRLRHCKIIQKINW
jgi:hypothetical protein